MKLDALLKSVPKILLKYTYLKYFPRQRTHHRKFEGDSGGCPPLVLGRGESQEAGAVRGEF